MGSWYQLQAGADASIIRRMEAAVRGEELPPPDRMERIRTVMIELSRQPSPAGLRLRRMRNLIALPSEVLGDPIVLAAANDFLARRLQRVAHQCIRAEDYGHAVLACQLVRRLQPDDEDAYLDLTGDIAEFRGDPR